MAKAYSRRNGEFLVNTQTANDQSGPRIAATADGGFIIVWIDGSLIGGDSSGVGVKAQRFDASGSPLGGEFLVNTTTIGNQTSPSVAVLGSGRFIVTWTDTGGADSSGNGIQAQLFEADGTPVGSEFFVNSAVAGNQGPSVVAELSSGGFVIAWTDFSGQGGDSSGSGIKAQLFNGAGAKLGGEFLVNTTTLGGQGSPSVTSSASGGFAVAWTDSAGAHFQLFDGTGAKVGGEQLANALSGSTYFLTGVNVAAAGSGFVVSWAQSDSPPAVGVIPLDIREQRFDASGNKVGGEVIVNTTTAGQQSTPYAHGLSDGGYLITWQGPGEGTTGTNVYGQAFDSSGAKIGSEFVLGTTLDGTQTGAKLTALASGDIVLAWTDGSGLGGDSSSFSVKAQILTPTTDAPTGIALSNTIVSETAVENLPVATLSASSSAVFDSFSYSIVTDSSGGAFGIEGDKLVVVDSSKLDFETQPNLSVTVRVTDLNGGSHDTSFALAVADAAIEARHSIGPELEVSFDTTGFNTPQSVIPLSSGGYLAITHDAQIGQFDKFDGRIFDSSGNPVTGTFDLAIPNGSFGDAAPLAGGGFVIAYRGASMSLPGGSNGFPIRAHIYDGSGHAVGADFLVSTSNNGILSDPSVATLASGGFVVTWTLPVDEGNDPNAPFPSQVRGQLFTASGVPVGSEFRINSSTVGAQNFSQVEALAGGGFAVTWRDSATSGIEGQIFDSQGHKVGGEFTVVTGVADINFMKLTLLDSGNLLVTWSEVIDDSGSIPIIAYEGELIGPDGVAIGGPIDLALGTDGAYTIAAVPGGGFVLGVSVVSLATLDEDDNDAWVQFFSDSGAPVGDPFLIASSTDNESIGGIAALDSGTLAFVLSRGFIEGGYWTSDAFARLISPVGPPPAIDGGTVGNDILVDTPGADQINGLAGDDRISVQDGHDRIDGGAGTDILKVDYSAATAAVTVSGIQTGTGDGWQGDVGDLGSRDVIFDNIERLELTSGSGDDVLVGIGGVNVFHTGAGNDQLAGNAGNDVLDGGSGADTMAGGLGNDVYYVDNVGDVVTETAGEGLADEVRTSLTGYVLPANVEKLTWTGAGGGDLRGNSGDNFLTGGTGNDFVRAQDGGNDNVSLGAGNDAVIFGASYTSGDVVDGGSGSDQVGLQGDYSGGVTLGTLTGVETLAIMTHSDARFGGGSASPYSYNILAPDSTVAAGTQLMINASTLEAGENLTFDGHLETNGSFFIYGGKGVDTLTGGSGADVFFFAEDGRFSASDHVDGGAGLDAMVLRGNYSLTLSGTSIVNVETVVLNSGSDARFYAAGTPFSYDITTADDTVAAGQTMTFNGGQLSAAETLHFDGSLETNGNFRLFGGSAADVIKGGAGNDLIYGGLGQDDLTGGGGADVFRYQGAGESTATATDRILDFASGDVIDLGRIDAVTGGNDDAFHLAASFTGQAGELVLTQGANNVWTVSGDVDGNGQADFQILVTVNDGHLLGSGDFVL